MSLALMRGCIINFTRYFSLILALVLYYNQSKLVLKNVKAGILTPRQEIPDWINFSRASE